MSLIYDYLKIQGKDSPESGPDVELPPVLKRRDTSRINSRSLLLIIGSCLAGILFLFLVTKIFSPGQYEPVIVSTEPDSPAKIQEEQPVESAPSPTSETVSLPVVEIPAVSEQVVQDDQVSPEPEKTAVTETIVIDIQSAATREKPPAETVAIKAAEPLAASEKVVQERQILPEPEKTAAAETVVIDIQPMAIMEEPQRDIPKKIIQPLKLESTTRKITFPENVPVYTEPKETPESKAGFAPEPVGRSSAAETKIAVYTPVKPAAMEQSRKFYQAGLQAQRKGDGRLAEIYYNRALDENPGHLNAMVNLSALLVQQERYPEAEEILVDILAMDPTNSKALVNLGVVNLYSGDEKLAASRFRAALAANPTEENGLINLIYLAEKNRDYASAERYYRQLLQISPDNVEVLLAYGHLLEEQGRYHEAVALYADTRELAAVKKDQRLYERISERMRMLARGMK